jgi:kinesin family member 6/9
MGDAQSYEHRGVAPRAIMQLFNEINSRIELEFKVSCTYMEIYNEKIFDLLSDLTNPDQATDYTIAEEKDGRGVFVRGLAEVEVKDENSTLNLLFSGGLSRTIATHKLNKQSNRSHSLFTIYVQQRQRSGVSERVVHSKLHLVDLAGSERLKKTMGDVGFGDIATDTTRKESMAINRSLTYLEQCVVALARRGHSHVPYRQSKLTNVLKDCLGANCNTVMLACMWGEMSHLEETVSTLRLAARMMGVQNETVSVETVDPSALIKKQEKIIRALKQELLMHDALVERTGVTYEPYTPEQRDTISQMLERYLETPELEEESVLNITNYRQMLEICKQFKKKVLTARTDLKIAQEQVFLGAATGDGRVRTATAGDQSGLGATSGAGASLGGGGRAVSGGLGMTGAAGMGGGLDYAADSKLAQSYDPHAATVGEAAASGRGGFALGISSADSRPLNGIEGASRYASASVAAAKYSPPTSPKKGMGMTGTAGVGTGSKFAPSPDNSPGRGGARSVDFGDTAVSGLGPKGMAMFEAFTRSDAGDALFREFTECKALFKEQRQKSKDLGYAVNEAKNIIDSLQRDIDLRKSSRLEFMRASASKATSSKDEIVDEEELRLANEIKEAKRTYRNCFEQMQRHKKGSLESQARAEQLKNTLGRAFNQWSAANGGGATQGFGGGGGGASTMMMTSPDYRASSANGRTDTSVTSPERPQQGNQLDQLDDQEAFDILEIERVLANDPESLAFFNAQKTRRANITQNGGSLKRLQKNKRFN